MPVAEDLLKDRDRRSLSCELGCPGVTEDVGMDAALDSGLGGESREQPADVGGVESPPVQGRASRSTSCGRSANVSEIRSAPR
jgi:hypothetical protein